MATGVYMQALEKFHGLGSNASGAVAKAGSCSSLFAKLLHNAKALPVARGCGTRKADGIYIEVGVMVATGKLSASLFIIDPPVPVSEALPLPVQGMGLIIDPQGTWHLLDRVGTSYYPYPNDFIEEARFFGISRRVQKNLSLWMKDGLPLKPGSSHEGATLVNGFSLLTEKSRLILAHSRAHIENWEQYRDGGSWQCPKSKSSHHPSVCSGEMCAGIWWEDGNPALMADGKPTTSPSGSRMTVVRKLPSFLYTVRERPHGVTPHYRTALFASFPISRIVVVEGEQSSATVAKLTAATVLPVALEPQ